MMKIALSLTPDDFKTTYDLKISITKEDKCNVLKQKMDVAYLRTLSGRSRIFSVARVTSVLVNDQPATLSTDELAHQAGAVFYPLELEIGFNGKYLCIYNVEVIKERWMEKKIILARYFNGVAFDKYIALMDQAINNTKLLNQIFRNDPFIYVFFNELYIDYEAEKELAHQLFFSPAPSLGPMEFKIQRSLQMESENPDAFVILHSGILDDQRTEWEINNGLLQSLNDYSREPIVKGSYQCNYLLNRKTGRIESITAQCKTEINKGVQIGIEVKATNKTQGIVEENIHRHY